MSKRKPTLQERIEIKMKERDFQLEPLFFYLQMEDGLVKEIDEDMALYVDKLTKGQAIIEMETVREKGARRREHERRFHDYFDPGCC
jgi:hypothetical protein